MMLKEEGLEAGSAAREATEDFEADCLARCEGRITRERAACLAGAEGLDALESCP
ncbi:MAG: hypothetical protein H6744_09995 [Deltaproteobacteria bacterium]|nr:hypothetical protein [Deltaproteobacteria bacterium]